MIILKNLFSYLYYPLRLYNKSAQFFFRRGVYRLRVLIYHGVSLDQQDNFKKQIDIICSRWNFITPNEFKCIVNGSHELKKDSVLLTFDDGFYSCLSIYENILKPRNIKSIFFIITDYLKLSADSDWRTFLSNNILHCDIDKEDECLRNLRIDELKLLLEDGNTLGAHTQSHVRCVALSKNEYQAEIVEGAIELESILGLPTCDFAYTYGDFSSITFEAYKIATSKFGYIYTGLRGDNKVNSNPFVIRRDSVSLSMSNLFLLACLEGVFDIFYYRKLRILDAWSKNLND